MITPLDQHQFLSEPERILLREWRKTRECELILTILNTATRFPASNDETPRSAEERIGEVNAANTELRDRLATIQGELNAANERYNARVKRALDWAKAGVKTKKENRERAGAEPLRINLPVAQAEGVTT